MITPTEQAKIDKIYEKGIAYLENAPDYQFSRRRDEPPDYRKDDEFREKKRLAALIWYHENKAKRATAI